MSRAQTLLVRSAGGGAAIVALVCIGVAAARAQSEATANDTTGRIDFAAAQLPQAKVEVDLGPEMFSDMFGLGDAAVAGIAESLLESAGTQQGSEASKLAAEQLAAVQQILQLAKEVVYEVRVRVYESVIDDSGNATAFAARFDEQLRVEKWDNVVRVQEDANTVRVSLVRKEGAIRGAFVVASDGENMVLANVVCDISPENVKKLSAAATEIGLQNGLQQVLEEKMQHHH
jgi:Domain of unknown function (DUF4252)